MSYSELAALLIRLGDQIAAHQEVLEGPSLAKTAEGLEKAALRFQKKLEDFLGGKGPGIRELEELFASPQGRTHLKLPALFLLYLKVFGERLQADKPAAAKKAFLSRVKGEGMGEKAVEVVRAFFIQAAQRPAPAKDEASLQNEFLRLGGLTDEELAVEFGGRLKSLALLKALAKANAVPFSKETSKEKLIERITHYARRAHGNIRHRAGGAATSFPGSDDPAPVSDLSS
jgi:hypothetical protein